MKYLILLFLVTGCSGISHFDYVPPPYSVTQTYRACDNDGKCVLMTQRATLRDCGGWDPEIAYGWEACDPKTIPDNAIVYGSR